MRDVIDSVCQTPWRAAKMKRAPSGRHMLYLLDRVSIEGALTLEQAPVLWPRYMHDKFRLCDEAVARRVNVQILFFFSSPFK